MKTTSLATTVAFASLAMATPMKRDSAGKQVMYWGNNNGGARSLASYCAAGQGIDIIVLSFIDGYGNGNAPSGFFNSNPSCTIATDGSTSAGCAQIGKDITTCQANGIQVLMSIGGGGGSGSVTSQTDAESTATFLWNWFGNQAYSTDSSGPRPFGDARVDGFDLDIEANPNGANVNYQYLVAKLRSLWSQDTSYSYVISGAPQCPLPEASMGSMIESFAFDYLFVQFYNNPQVCDAKIYITHSPSYAYFNYDDWVTYLDKTPSANAKMFIGVPASTAAANSVSYVAPEDLAPLVNEYKSHPKFGGLMEWEASQSDTLNDNGHNFAQEIRCILDTGSTC